MWHDHAFQAPITFDLQSMLAPLLESLHLELQQQLITRMEDLVRPLRDLILAIRFWIARVATHMKHVKLPMEETSIDVYGLFASYAEPCGGHTSNANMAKLFTLVLMCGTL